MIMEKVNETLIKIKLDKIKTHFLLNVKSL